MCGGSGRLAHREACARDARGRLAAVGHRGAAPGDQQVFYVQRDEHAVWQLVETASTPLEAEFDISSDMFLHWPAVDADGVWKIHAIEDVVFGEQVFAAHAARLPDADLRRD